VVVENGLSLLVGLPRVAIRAPSGADKEAVRGQPELLNCVSLLFRYVADHRVLVHVPAVRLH
jgi:hypothetical protein